jgi:uroporphyrinogen decarboxylase
MKQYREDPQLAAKSLIESVERYGLDGVLFDVDTALLASAIGVPTDYPADVPARTHQPLLDNLADVFRLNEVDISKNIRIQHALETVKILKNYFKDEVYVRGNCDQCPFSLATMVRTPVNFMMDLMLDEENAIILLKYCTDITKQMIQLMATTGADMVSNGDSPAGPDMISPDMYRKFALPYEQEIVNEAHACHKPYLLHICGNTDLILEDIADLDLDAVELDYKTSIDKIHETMHDKCTLFGTVDPSGVITYGSVKEVEQKTLELLKIYRGFPRLVVNAGCAIPKEAPHENIKRFVDTVHEWSE